MANITDLAVNNAPEAFQPVVDTVQPVLGTLSALLGGLFGLYLILILVRVYYERRKVHLLMDIRYDLDYLNQHFKVPYSQEKKPLKVKRKIMPIQRLKEEIKKIEARKKLRQKLKERKKAR